MKTTLTLSSIFIHSEENKKSFFADFGSKLNVIYGANTSGKSTIIQLMLYAFGINDNKQKLNDILSEKIFVRVDFNVSSIDKKTYTVVRNDETLFIKSHIDSKTSVFTGVSGNNSYEHVKLKEFISSILNFDMMLETKSGISKAPLETIFLPYYVAQDVGWVYLRKSFSNLDFYKNFKEDFLDYYLGIDNSTDRSVRKKLQTELAEKQQRFNFYHNFEKNDHGLTSAKIIDDSLKGKGEDFILELSSRKSELLKLENKYIRCSNQYTFNNQRLAVISKVSRNHGTQFPGKDTCPICNQILPAEEETLYKYLQEGNDTLKVKKEIQSGNKEIQSEINSLTKQIDELRQQIASDYVMHTEYSKEGMTLNEWISVQANIKLEESLITIVGELSLEIAQLKDKLKEFKKDDEIETERNGKNKDFKKYYFSNNLLLDVPQLEESRFNYIYELSSFPFQGVQLHLAVLSYHFAFNKLINETSSIHRLPFILDSVFKEDLEAKSKEDILGFICNNLPEDTQTIISIADNNLKEPKIEDYNSKFFKNNARLICIGEARNKKSILVPHSIKLDQILNDTYEMMEQH